MRALSGNESEYVRGTMCNYVCYVIYPDASVWTGVVKNIGLKNYFPLWF